MATIAIINGYPQGAHPTAISLNKIFTADFNKKAHTVLSYQTKMKNFVFTF